MPATDVTDEELLTARDAASFERFYLRHVNAVLAYFSRRTRDPELSADLCAETFAAALASRHRFRPGQAPATAWLFGIGSKKLADAQRRGYAEMRARRRLGMERIELSDEDLARIDRLGDGDEAQVWMERLRAGAARRGPRPRDRRAALRRDRGRVGDVRGSGAQAGQPRAGGDANADGSASMNQDFVTQLQLQLREAALREERRTPAAQRFVRARRGLPARRRWRPRWPSRCSRWPSRSASCSCTTTPSRSRRRSSTRQGPPTTCSRSRPAPAPWASGPGRRGGAAHRAGDAEGPARDPARRRGAGDRRRRRGVGTQRRSADAGAQGAMQLRGIDPKQRSPVVARMPMRSPEGDDFSRSSSWPTRAHLGDRRPGRPARRPPRNARDRASPPQGRGGRARARTCGRCSRTAGCARSTPAPAAASTRSSSTCPRTRT